MLCVFPWDESLEEEKRREEPRKRRRKKKLFQTGKWRLLPTPTTLWSFPLLSELGSMGWCHGGCKYRDGQKYLDKVAVALHLRHSYS